MSKRRQMRGERKIQTSMDETKANEEMREKIKHRHKEGSIKEDGSQREKCNY